MLSTDGSRWRVRRRRRAVDCAGDPRAARTGSAARGGGGVKVGAVRSRSKKMLRAVRTLSPQGRAKRRALNAGGVRRRAARASARRGGAHYAWSAQRDKCVVRSGGRRAAALWLMGRAGAAFGQQGLRAAMNGWVEAAAELGQRRRLLRGIVSPELRAARRGLNRWVEMVDERAMMRRAGASMRQRGFDLPSTLGSGGGDPHGGRRADGPGGGRTALSEPSCRPEHVGRGGRRAARRPCAPPTIDGGDDPPRTACGAEHVGGGCARAGGGAAR